tara:strand:+ start:18599 stop:19135 length:537 start_codon:yes stop_codon:yes gene_type:complete
MKYFDELKRSMEFIASKQNTLFVGQAVEYAGTAMSSTLKEINSEKLFELPVAEEFQMGVSIGMAMGGLIPISIFPRWNFLILAANQLITHLDKMKEISNDGYAPKVIIRTGIGSQRPLHPQHQHIGDFTDAFRMMLKHINIVRLEEPEEIFPSYKEALEREDGVSTLLIEYGDYYNEK